MKSLANSSKNGKSKPIETYSFAYKALLSLLMFFIFSFAAHSTHVVGGGITYMQMENNNYLITVKLYKDCSPGTANIPNTINLKCRRGPDGSTPPTIGNLILPRISRDTLSPDIPLCSFDPGICVEEAIYQSVVNLPSGVGGYHLYYRICCRNGTIQNITNPLNAQETFYAYVPDNFIYQSNSSPFFNEIPPVYVCAGDDLNLDFSAIDPDGDQLVYSFYTPYDGQNNGGITYGPGAPPNNINISPVTWVGGFGATDPLDAAAGLLPGLTISPTGLISGTPTAPGQYVVGVMVDEYRNGVLIGRITRDFQFNVINCPPPNTAIIDVQTVCNGLNVDFINASTGTPTTFWWNFGTGNPADSSIAFQPSFTFPAPGTYTIDLILDKGTECADTTAYQLTVLDLVQFNVAVDSVNCTGGTDGSALAASIDPLYVYDWSTFQQGSFIDNLPVGNYWVQATNSLGCVDTIFFPVYDPTPLVLQFNGINPLCNGDSNGSIEALVSGGSAPYSYLWPNQGSTTNPLTNIPAGVHPVQVTDINGCVINGQSIINNPTILNTQVSSQVNVSCFGLADASVMINAFGGTPNYSIDWLTLSNDAFFMDSLSVGNYVAEVTDNNGCMSTIVVGITQPDTFFVDLVIIQEETCTGSNGQAFADVTNGVGTISYLWIPTNQTTDVATGLASGPIQVLVEDQNGCQDQAFAILLDNPTGTASIGNSTPVSCLNGNDGMVNIAMTGGTAPFQYNWSCACPNINIQSNLTAGNYWVNVTDANGCSDVFNFIVTEVPALIVDVVDLALPTCYNFSDGYIEVGAVGGTTPYSYLWNTNPTQNSAIATGLNQGQYGVVVTDANGCVDSTALFLNHPTELIVSAQSIGNVICFGDSSGVANVQVVGATPPYSYLWMPTQEITATIDSLPAGFYSIAVVDANGCMASDVTEIIEYAHVTAEIIPDSVFCPGEMVNFYVSTNGLNNQYNYNWFVNQVLQGTNNSFTYPIQDTSEISIVLVNTGNCPDVQDTITVGPIKMQPNNVDITGTPDTICVGSSAVLQGYILDTTYVTSLNWSVDLGPSLGPHLVTPQQSTTYYLTIENICGEEQTDSLLINVFDQPNAYVISDGTSGCDEVFVDFSYAYDTYQYQLNDVSWTINYEDYDTDEPQVSFTYSAGVTANLFLSFSNGCTFEYNEIVDVEVFESPEANFYFNPDPALQGEVTEFVDISHGNPQEWEWYFEGNLIATEERPSYVFDETGEYEVTQIVINEYGCSDTMIHLVEVIGSYTVFVPNAFTPDGNGHNNSFKPIMLDVVAENYQFLIFNRWGEVIFKTDDLEGQWDGNFQGEIARDGVYIWKIFVTDNVGLEHEMMGHVTLLR